MKRLKGIVELPLHYGSCPRWLFPRMVKLAGVMGEMIVSEYGAKEFLSRLSEPYWFQAFGCALGFDWHSSGLTTTACGALKEALKKNDFGVNVAGGKGIASRKTPQEIEEKTRTLNLNENNIRSLIRSSRLVAKVDNNALQDGFQLYHHSFFFDDKGNWSVVQQGMNDTSNYARRYHWLSSKIEHKSFVNEPHSAVCCDVKVKSLNLVAKESREIRECSIDLIKDNPQHLNKYLKSDIGDNKSQKTLLEYSPQKTESFSLSREHFPDISLNMKILMQAYKLQPENYEELILIKGLGAKNLRALALLSELIYGCRASWRDPVKFSFAHGGKDGWPFPVNKDRYDKSVQMLQDALRQAKLGRDEKIKAIKRLSRFRL